MQAAGMLGDSTAREQPGDRDQGREGRGVKEEVLVRGRGREARHRAAGSGSNGSGRGSSQ